MSSTIYLQALCLTTTPRANFIAALTDTEIDAAAFHLDSAWFEDLQDDMVLLQLLWPQLTRPPPPRDVVRGDFLALAQVSGDAARPAGLEFLDFAPREPHTAICWTLAATRRRRDWAPPAILDSAIDATLHKFQAPPPIP